MHLPTRADRFNSPHNARIIGERFADHFDRTRPPVGGPLFRPSVMRHDLVVFVADQFQNLSRRIHQRGAHATRTNVDRQKKCIPVHLQPPFRTPYDA